MLIGQGCGAGANPRSHICLGLSFCSCRWQEEGLRGPQSLCFFSLHLPGTQKQESQCFCAPGTVLSPLTESATPAEVAMATPPSAS